MRVLIYYPYSTGKNAFSGGVSKVIVSNIKAVFNNGDEPFLILPATNDGLIDFLADECPYCKVIPLQIESLSLYSDTKSVYRYVQMIKGLYRFALSRKILKKEFKKINPDVIHFHEIINFPILQLCRSAKIVLHVHSYRFFSYKTLLPIIMRYVNKYADILISPTQSIIDGFGDSLNKPIVLVNTPYLELKTDAKHNLDDVKDIVNLSEKKEKVIFCFAGRICSIKRVDHFLKACSSLDDVYRNKIHFCIVGGSNVYGDILYKDNLLAIIKENKLENNVSFMGYISPIEKILPYIDYGVVLSESEAVPMIGIEFMRFNIPIIGYKAPGITDFLFENINGILIENGNIKELESILKSIISNKIRKESFNNNIETEFKKYTLGSFELALKDIYK